MRERSRVLSQAVGRVIGFDELALGIGLGMMAYGFADVWRPGMFIIPGAVIVWIALPVRKAFIERPAPPTRERG